MSTEDIIASANQTIAIHDGVMRLKEENARLRAALQEIASIDYSYRASRIAREALGQTVG